MTRMGIFFLSDFVRRALLKLFVLNLKPQSTTTHSARNKRRLRLWYEIPWLFFRVFFIINRRII